MKKEKNSSKKDIEMLQNSVSETNLIKKSQKKTIEKIPVKKLPKIFKKKYTETKFKNKISKHIFIQKDLEFIQKFFVTISEQKRTLLVIPQETLFSKNDIIRLKNLAKQIKQQKSRVKWIPFFICIGIIVAIFFTIITFKDIIIKKGLKASLETIFEAKCDISYLHLGILDSNFTIKGLAVADKKNTMTNLFEVENFTLDFDLIQLLKKRFTVDEIDISNIQLGTQRTTDGALPPKPKKQKKSKEDSKFQKQLNTFTSEKSEILKNSLTEIFNQYNPGVFLKDFYSQLKSPSLINEIQDEVAVIIPKWQKTPNELTETITQAINNGQEAVNFDWGKVKTNPTLLKNGIELVSNAIKEIENVKNNTNKIIDNFEKDLKTINVFSSNVKSAVDSDYKLINTEINKIKSFSLKEDGVNILTNSLNKVIADLLGKYYPTFQKIVSYAQNVSFKTTELNQNKKKSEKEKKEKVEIQRYKGRYVEYKNDKTPNFLIKKIHGSGKGKTFGLDISILDISNDMSKWDKPISIQGSAVHNGMSDSILGFFDLRENRTKKMLELNYTGSGYDVSLSVPEESAVQGIPSMNGKGVFTANFNADLDGSFSLKGNVLMSPVTFETVAFEPVFAYSLYNINILKNIFS